LWFCLLFSANFVGGKFLGTEVHVWGIKILENSAFIYSLCDSSELSQLLHISSIHLNIKEYKDK
jgi:hypothetical protein